MTARVYRGTRDPLTLVAQCGEAAAWRLYEASRLRPGERIELWRGHSRVAIRFGEETRPSVAKAREKHWEEDGEWLEFKRVYGG